MARTLTRRLAKSRRLENAVRNSIAGDEIVERFIAGEHPATAAVVAMRMAHQGLDVTFGQTIGSADTEDEAEAATQVYLETITVAKGAGVDDLDLSVSLPALGLSLGADGAALADANLRRIADVAAQADATVTVDMGHPRHVDAVLAAVAELRQHHPNAGVTLQAYLRRTRTDLADWLTPGSRVRLCKGAFPVPDDHDTFPTTHMIDTNLVRLLRLAMESPAIPLVATHDHRMVSITHELVRRSGRTRDDYEFQMLMGTRPLEHRRLVDTGRKVRVYLPYGRDWYPYLVHRIGDHPRLLGRFTKQLVNRR